MNSTTPQEARQIAEEAYIFAYPMLMSYRAIYVGGLDESSPFFRASFNQLVHDTRPADHSREDVVTMNGDTPYSNFGLDLGAEPVVVSVPDVLDRYYVMQFADLYTHNFAYIGTRSTGSKAGHYLFVGPKWVGEIPTDKFDKVFESETDLVVAIGRTQLLGLVDLPNVLDIQQGYKVTPLSVFMGEEPKVSPGVDWLPWNPAIMGSIDFIEYFNFLLTFCEPIHPDDQLAMERFARIGIAPDKKFDASQLEPAIREGMQEGVEQASQKLSEKSTNIARQVNGWNMTDAIGSREFFKGGDWLLRAAAAQSAIYMNDKIEAFYPIVYVDADGQTLDGKSGKYMLRFEKGKFPPAKYFWSVTLYDKRADGTAGYMVDNPIDRYLINSTTEGLIYGEDGSLIIYIQHQQPEGEKAANWLPAPAKPFYMAMRIYGPEESVMNDEWEPPSVVKAV